MKRMITSYMTGWLCLSFLCLIMLGGSSLAGRGARVLVNEAVITGADQSVFAITYDVNLYVDPAAGDDANSGLTPVEALRTLAAASSAALSANALNNSVKIHLLDGEYRDPADLVDLTPGGTSAPIELAAVNPGMAVLLGSDVWNGWTSVGNGVYSMQWTDNWGATNESWVPSWAKIGGGQVENELLQRREQVFIDGKVQIQVLSQNELTDNNSFNGQGSFFIDETNDLIYLKPAPEVDPNVARTEVSVRPSALRDSANRPENVIWIERENVAIRGLVIKHHALGVRDAIHLRNARNVLIEDCDVSFHPWAGIGLSFGINEDITIRRCVTNYNGALGIIGGGSGLKNIVVEGCIMNWNNYRGETAGTIDWATAGIKLAKLHDARIENSTANFNRADGFWTDLEGKNVVYRRLVGDQNLRVGIDFEVMQGPVLLEDSRFVENQRWQVLVAASEDVTIDQIVAWRDSESYYTLNGFADANKRRGSLTVWQQNRTETDWETGTPLNLMPEYMTIRNSGFRERDGRLYNRWGAGSANDPLMTYESWFSTLLSNNNRFFKTGTSIAGGDASDDPQHSAFDNQNNQERPLSSQSGYTDFWRNFSGMNDGQGQDLQSLWGDFSPDDIVIVPPGQPSSLSGTAISHTEVILNWTDNSSNESVFVLEYSTDGITYSLIDDAIPADMQAISVAGLVGSTDYHFRLKSRNSVEDSSYTHAVKVTTLSGGGGDVTPPSAPAGLVASAGNAEVLLDWDDNIEPDLAGYRVYRSDVQGSGYEEISGLIAQSLYTDLTATNGVTYYYVTTAADTSANESGLSNEVSATPQAPPSATVHVQAILVYTNNLAKGAKQAGAEVTVVDSLGNPVAGVTVTGTFSGGINETVNAQTDASGVAVLLSQSTSKGGFALQFCVDDLSHPVFSYASADNVVTCDTL